MNTPVPLLPTRLMRRSPLRASMLKLPLSLNLRSLMVALSLLVIYVVLDWAAYSYAAGPLAVTPWNPAPGVGTALLLALGNTWVPVLFAAILLSEMIVRHAALSLPQALLLSALLTAGYTALASMLRTGPLAIDPRLTRMRDLILLTLCTTGMTLVIAVIYVLVQTDLEAIRSQAMLSYIIRSWIGDLIGILVFAPLILLLWSGRMGSVQRKSDAFAHGFGILLAALFAFWVVYGNVPAEQITSLYLLFIPLIWVSIRFGLRGAVVASIALQLGVILLSHLGSQSDATVLQFQIRLLVIAATGLFLGAAVDELHSAEQKLRERQSELDRTLRLAASAELASAMAHELNQPLSAIGIYIRNCEMMLRARPVPVLQETMRKVANEVRRAGEVVHKLREFYRSGSSRLEAVAVGDLLRHAVENMQERASRHQISITHAIEQGLPAVAIDRIQIETVLHNLLSNAIEAIRDGGGTERQITLDAKSADKGRIMITVSDTGPGVDADDAEQLFRPFTSSKAYGLGLGLSMSSSIVAAHAGTLRVVPGPGGCCFEFTLPSMASVREE